MTRPAPGPVDGTRVGRLVLRGVAGVLVSVLVLVLFAPSAGAHAVLQEASPDTDEQLVDAPRQIRLEFNETVTATTDGIRVIDPTGEEISGIQAGTDGSVLSAELPELDLGGSYTVAWKVVSADGHPVSGAYLFHLQDRTLSEPAEVADVDAGLLPGALRAVGAVLAIGAVTALLAGLSQRYALWSTALVGTLVALLGAMLAVGGNLWDALLIVVETTSGVVTLAAVFVAAAGLVLVPVRHALPTTILASALVVVLAGQGHAVSLEPVWLSASLTILHVVAAVGWAVGLLYLARRSDADEPEALQRRVLRFSPWAAAAVVLVAFSGVVLVLDRVPLEDLVHNNYGRLAIVKVVLLAAAMVLVGVNRFRLTPLLTEHDDARRRFGRSVRAEVVVLSLALVTGGVLAQVPPMGADGGMDLIAERLEFGPGVVDVTIEPARRGTNEMHVIALGEDGRLMGDIEELTLAMTLPEMDIGPLVPEMIVITAGHSMVYADIPLAGEWEMTVTARASQFEEYSATFTAEIRR